MLFGKQLKNRKYFYDKKNSTNTMIKKNGPTFRKKQMEEKKMDGVKLSLLNKTCRPSFFPFSKRFCF